MSSVSALLSSAKSARQKKRNYDDSVAAFEWNVSAKTYDDFQNYTDYLNKRLSTVGNPTKVISYSNKLVSAKRAYTSKTIQRQAIGVLEGNQTSQGKYNAMYSLYQSSVESGDLNLAQSIRSQMDSLDIRIQNEASKANKVASTLSSANANSILDMVDYVEQQATTKDAKGNDVPAGFQYTNDKGETLTSPTLAALSKIYQDGGEETINAVAKEVSRLTGKPQSNFWDIAKTAIEQVQVLYQDAAQVVGETTSAGRRYLKKAASIASGSKTFDFAPGLGKLSLNDVKDAIDASNAGQQLFVPSLVDGKNVFAKTNITDVVYGRDENGNYRVIEVRNQFADNFGKSSTSEINIRNLVEGKLTTTGTISVSEAIDKLKSLGYNVNSSGGSLTIQTTGQSSGVDQLAQLGILQGTSFNAIISDNGNLRFETPNGIFDLNLGDNSLAISEVKKEDVSILGDTAINSFPTKEGVNIMQSIQNSHRAVSDLLVRQASAILVNQTTPQPQQAVLPTPTFAALNSSPDLQLGSNIGLNQTPVPNNAGLTVKPVPYTPPLQVTTPVDNRTVSVQPIPLQPDLTVSNRQNNNSLFVDNSSSFSGSLQVR